MRSSDEWGITPLNNTKLRQTLMPLLAALIWGMAFSVQSRAAAYYGAFTLNSLRYFIGALFLTLVLKLLPSLGKNDPPLPGKDEASRKKQLILGGIICGIALAAASCLQQMGIRLTTAGKASFITALYVVLVPLASLLFGKKLKAIIWIAVAVAVCGLYFISVNEGFSISRGDFLVFLSAFCFAAQILCIDHYVGGVSAVRLSRVQFLTAGVISGILALFTDTLTFADFKAGLLLLLYMGIMSTGVAYTLQVVSQQGGEAPIVSILLSMESVFGALGGYLFLHESLSARELLGCGLMFAAVLLTQLPEKRPNGSL